MSEDYEYVGSELDLFSQATNWKRYYASLLRPYIHGRVLEVGAGIGGTTPYLWNRTCSEWVCLEPDRRLLEKLRANLASHPEMTGIETSVGTTADIPNSEKYDCILYIDVLEHLEQDRAELDKASNFVAEGGRIIVLSPAHQWLFSPFDAALGHVRRYTRKTLKAAIPPSLVKDRILYLDAVGIAASFTNRLFLKQSSPTAGQIAFWDKRIVPASRILDPLLFRSLGKSIVGILKKS